MAKAFSWFLEHLPVVLLTVMVLIANVLEWTVVPPWQWQVKLPLTLLLLGYFFIGRGEG